MIEEEGTLTYAAARMHISQPTLTQHVQALERDLGVSVFRRHKRGTQLTPAGRAFLTEARQAVTLMHKAKRAARRAAQGVEVSVQLATVRSLAAGLLPKVVGSIHRSQPGLQLELSEFGHSSQVEDAVLAMNVELAIGPKPSSEVDFRERLFRESFVIILSPSLVNKYREDETVDLSDLTNEYWVMFHTDHGLSDLVDMALKNAGVAPRVAVRTSQVDAAVNLAAAGLGVSIVPALNVPPHHESLARPLAQPLNRDIYIYSLKEPDRELHELIQVFRHETTALNAAGHMSHPKQQ